MSRYVCIHGHFYQPPRQNPWLESIERQPSAYPYHDWNQRISAECYAPNTASRILNGEKRVIKMVNNYQNISFNFGPTLLSWMKDNDEELYNTIIASDRMEKSDSYGAMAQCYNHIIMPLADKRDKETQIIWGIEDFRYRFNREPKGMWLPETAVDLGTLEIMADRGLQFVILAPHQAEEISPLDSNRWIDVSDGSIDTRVPYLCRLPSGKEISIFFYDGHTAKDVAFNDLLKDGKGFARRIQSIFSQESIGEQVHEMVNIATDGETYGHHHSFGEMALSYCLYYLNEKCGVKITDYHTFLNIRPPDHLVRIKENSSWSCFHGVERWRSDCGCTTGGMEEWNQKWRGPLREALDWLRKSFRNIYTEETKDILKDPWEARNSYIEVILDRSMGNLDDFAREHCSDKLNSSDLVKLLRCWEMQRQAMLMYTSCGWFFAEISGIETLQIMAHALRGIQLAKVVSGKNLEPVFLDMLEKVPSNIPEIGSAADIFRKEIKHMKVDFKKAAAHFVLSSVFRKGRGQSKGNEEENIYSFRFDSEDMVHMKAGNNTLVLGKGKISSAITQASEKAAFAALHMGNQNLRAALTVDENIDEHSYDEMKRLLTDSFEKGDIPDVLMMMKQHFQDYGFTIHHLFKDQEENILERLLADSREDSYQSALELWYRHYSLINTVATSDMILPEHLENVVKIVVCHGIFRELREKKPDIVVMKKLFLRAERFGIVPDEKKMKKLLREWIYNATFDLSSSPEDHFLMDILVDILDLMKRYTDDIEWWRLQNVYYRNGKQIYLLMSEQAEKGDADAVDWLNTFTQLGTILGIRYGEI